MHVFSFICSLKILLLIALLWRISQGLKTSWLLQEFCWPLGNMLPAALLKIITFNAHNPSTLRSV